MHYGVMLKSIAMESYSISLITPKGDVNATLSFEESGDDFKVRLYYGDTKIEAIDEDCFGAFCSIREELESLEVITVCNGASLDVYPSGMARSMGDGTKAYRLTNGSNAKRSDLVHIFELNEGFIPSTVTEQEDFFDKWLNSLRN